MKPCSALLLKTILVGLIAGACSTRSDAPAGAGGSAGSGQGQVCSNAGTCGGSVLGSWRVSSSCLKVSGTLDLTYVDPTCPAPAITGSHQVTGTWTANADGSFSDNTVLTGDEQFALDASCLIISSTPTSCDGVAGQIKGLGYSEVTCTAAANNGCNCTSKINQAGGLGALALEPATSGRYLNAGSGTLTLQGVSDTSYSYCSSGSTLTLTPPSMGPTITGSVVLTKTADAGMGGAGSGGAVGTAGAAGAALAGSVGTAGSSAGGTAGAGMAGASGSTGTMGPCDIYKAGGGSCVAAHSMIRALSGAYGGK